MAKDIIILDVNAGDGGFNTVKCCFWIPNPNPVPRPAGVTSAYANADASEVAAIQAGSVIEEVRSFSFPNTLSQAQVEANLLAMYNARKTWYAAQVPPGKFYGIYHDSVTGWSA